MDATRSLPYELTEVNMTDSIVNHGFYASMVKLEYMGLVCVGKKFHNKPSTLSNFSKFEEECLISSKLQHPNIVQFLGVYFEEGSTLPIIVMEILHTNLTSCINANGVLPSEISSSILHDVALGLHYLHSQTPPVIHQHLSSNNVLITSGMRAKISDHGAAKLLSLSMKQVIDTIQPPSVRLYIAPEVLIADKAPCTSVDVFSYGILMIHMTRGNLPETRAHVEDYTAYAVPFGSAVVPTITPDQLGSHQLSESVDSSHPLYDLILKCCDHNPAVRPNNMNQILKRTSLMTSVFPATFSNYLEMLQKLEGSKEEIETLKMKVERRQILLEEKEGLLLSQATEHSRLNRTYSNDITELQEEIQQLKEENRTLTTEAKVKSSLLPPKAIDETRQRMKHQEALIKDAFQIIQYNLAEHRMILEGVLEYKEEQEDLTHTLEPKAPLPGSVCWSSTEDAKSSYANIMFTGASKISTWISKKAARGKKERNIEPVHLKAEGKLNYLVYIALHDYEPQKREDLPFKKGEHLYVLTSEGDWWFACSKETGKEGYVPSNFLEETAGCSKDKSVYSDINELYAQRKQRIFGSNPDLGKRCTDTRPVSQLLQGKRVSQLQGDSEISKSSTLPRTFKFKPPKKVPTTDSTTACESASPAPVSRSAMLPNIPQSQLKFVRQVGSLSDYKDTWEGVFNGTTPVLIQASKPSYSDIDIITEAECLQQLRHDSIIVFHGMCTTDRHMYMITELLPNGSLNSYLCSEAMSVTDHDLYHMAYQISCAMAYLETKGYVHRDLSTHHIQVGDNQLCKLTDFRLAKHAQGKDMIDAPTSVMFPIRWSAPEVFLQQQHSIKSDVWSFGVVFYAIITYGKKPYEEIETKEELFRKLEEGYRMPCPEYCPRELYKIILDCWEMEPSNRPSFVQLQHLLKSF